MNILSRDFFHQIYGICSNRKKHICGMWITQTLIDKLSCIVLQELFFWKASTYQYFTYERRWFLIFLASLLKRKINIKILLTSMKTHTNYGYFTGSRIRIPPPPTRLSATQRELWASIHPLKMPTINHRGGLRGWCTVTDFETNQKIEIVAGKKTNQKNK